MTVVIAVMLAIVAVAGGATALTHDPARQAVTLSAYGLCLAMLFMVLAAPDVALSQVTVGAAVVPLIVLLTVRRMRAPR